MDLFDVAKSCVRRWWVFLPLMAIVTLFSYRAYTGVQPVYYGSAMLGLAPPSVTPSQEGQTEVRSNALVNSGGIQLMANLLAMGLSNAAVHAQVIAEDGLPDYTANVFSVPGGQIPIVVIEATSPDPEAVTNTLEIVSRYGESTLQGIQGGAGVPADQLIHTYALGTPSDPVPGMPSRTRSTVAIFIAGSGIAVVVTVLVDVLLVRRNERTHRRQPPYQDPGSSESPRVAPDSAVRVDSRLAP